ALLAVLVKARRGHAIRAMDPPGHVLPARRAHAVDPPEVGALLGDPDRARGPVDDVRHAVTPPGRCPAREQIRGQPAQGDVNVARLPVVRGRPRLGPPLAGIGKVVCIGLNYTDHAREVGLPLPSEPLLFIKANSAISGPNDPIVRPPGAVKLDYEVELGAVI